MHSASELHYGPESLFYMRRQLTENGLELDPWHGLPPILAEIPDVMGEQTTHWAKRAAGDQPTLVALVGYVAAYEHFGPYHATRADWERFQSKCRLLMPELPERSAGPEHIVFHADAYGHQLPQQMFDSTARDAEQWSLLSILAWIDGDAMLHHSESLMGGPYGFKWALLILLFLFSCGQKIQDGHGPWYDGIVVRWLDADAQRVIDAAERLRQWVAESVTILGESRAAREVPASAQGSQDAPDLSWSYEEADVSVLSPRQDEWTLRKIEVAKYPGRRQILRNAPRAASHKRSRETMQDTGDSESSSSDSEGPPRKAGKPDDSQAAKGGHVRNKAVSFRA
ncbi:hypothetical protein FRC08_017392 [Ceratobasidium sp. 394]|nr:hypothetical protein FRC08_017392 [Ceratobasidium sp. 394]